jgi:predicted nucleic acid-binding protein
MNTILLDTNIVSFLIKQDSRVKDYAPHLQNHRLAISFMSVAELFQWAYTRNWGESRIRQLEIALKNYVVFAFDIEICRLWGEVRAECYRAGRPISSQDAWVAATARQHNLPLVTHNPKDFECVQNIEVITTVT